MSNGDTRDKTLLPLLLIVVGAILVRFIGLGRESFWNDEAFTGYTAQLPTLRDVFHFISFDVHPPGYFGFVWIWGRLFGMSDYALRASSAVAGVLLVPITYRLGRQLFDSKTGLVGAFLAAFIFPSIYYSQELRAYIFLAVFSALSVSLLIDCLQALAANQRQSPVKYIALLLVCGVNGYFHYFGLMFSVLVAATLVVYAFYFRRQRKLALLFSVGFFSMYAPWIPVVLGSVGRPTWIPAPTTRFVLESVNVFYGAGWRLDAIAAAVILIGYGFLFKNKGWKGLEGGDKTILAWILIPLVLSLIISLSLRPVYSPRNMLLAGVPAWLLLARGFTLLPFKRSLQWAAAIAVLLICHGIQAFAGHGYFVQPTKQQYREAAGYIAQHNPQRLPIYAIDWDKENYCYYLKYVGQDDLVHSISRLDVVKNGLLPYIKENRVWIASGGIDIYETTDLNRDFKVVDHAQFLLTDVYLVERRVPTK